MEYVHDSRSRGPASIFHGNWSCRSSGGMNRKVFVIGRTMRMKMGTKNFRIRSFSLLFQNVSLNLDSTPMSLSLYSRASYIYYLSSLINYQYGVYSQYIPETRLFDLFVSKLRQKNLKNRSDSRRHSNLGAYFLTQI